MMECDATAWARNRPVCNLRRARAQRLPLVFASPHSGRDYPAQLLAATRLDRVTLRRSEDAFIDEIFAAAPDLGAPLLSALFPRAYLDVNREPYELDPDMFEDPLPAHVNTRSPRVAAGLGTIARVVATGDDIYAGKLRFADAVSRVDTLYRPYHAALEELVAETREMFAYCILVDCHSMPSVGCSMERDWGKRRVDFVLGDCNGRSCAPAVMDAAEKALVDLGYGVARNAPYSGGFTTRHYGKPGDGVHGLQIEINRRLYMDELTIEKLPNLAQLAEHMRAVVAALGALDPALLIAPAKAAE